MSINIRVGGAWKDVNAVSVRVGGAWKTVSQAYVRVAGVWEELLGGGDPHFANVVLLLHFDGTDGSTTFTDSSGSPKTVAALNNAQIDTAQSVFGGASCLLDGTNDAVFVDDADGSELALGSGDWTIEMFVRFSSVSGNRVLYDGRGAGTTPLLYLNGGNLVYHANGATRITGPSLSVNTWYHVAVSRVSGTTRLFVDGVKQGSDYADATTYTGAADKPYLGLATDNSADLQGWIDEVRVTIGVGRYTSDFSPPTTAFPDS